MSTKERAAPVTADATTLSPTTNSIPTKAELRKMQVDIVLPRYQDHEPGITNEGYWAATNHSTINESEVTYER